MKIEFLGAVRNVTGSMHLFHVNGSKVLVECGLFQGRREEAFERNRHLPFDASEIDVMVLSHAHIDHTLANSQILEATGAQLAIHEIDAPTLKDPQGNLSFFLGTNPPQKTPNWELKAGDQIEFGNISLTVLHTPGHTPGGITLVSDGVAFTGDTLFNRGVGRTDLPGGDWPTLENSIRRQLFTLPDDTIAYPGHGPKTTIGDEKRLNPYIQMLEQG